MPFDEAKHPRAPSGKTGGGRFVAGTGNPAGSATIKDGLRVKAGGGGAAGKGAGKGKKGGSKKASLRRGKSSAGKQATQFQAAKRALIAAGLIKDGASDKQAMAALKRYQKARGMSADGKVSPALLERLRKDRVRTPAPRKLPRRPLPVTMRTDDPRHRDARLAAPATYRRSSLARR